MIAYLHGTIVEKDLGHVVLLCGGVGYGVKMPLSDIATLPPENDLCTLHIYTHVREEAMDLFGFLEKNTLKTFEKLIHINGVGPKLALAILSTLNVEKLHAAIESEDHKALTVVPGVGPKSAKRMVLELKGKLATTHGPLFSQKSPVGILEDLRSAIANLGYKSSQIEKAVDAIKKDAENGASIEVLVPLALRSLKG